MSSIAIFSAEENAGREIGLAVASELDYRLVTLKDLVSQTAKNHGLGEAELQEVFRTGAFWRGRLTKKRLQGLARLEEQLCRLASADRLVFAGYVGPELFRQISHVLRVLLIGGGGKSREGEAARKWFRAVYGRDLEDARHYDLTVNRDTIEKAEAVRIIRDTLRHHKFSPMTYSRKCLANLELSSRVKTLLVDAFPDVCVKAHDGSVWVYSASFNRGRQQTAAEVKQKVLGLEGVGYVEVYGSRKRFDEVARGQIC